MKVGRREELRLPFACFVLGLGAPVSAGLAAALL